MDEQFNARRLAELNAKNAASGLPSPRDRYELYLRTRLGYAIRHGVKPPPHMRFAEQIIEDGLAYTLDDGVYGVLVVDQVAYMVHVGGQL